MNALGLTVADLGSNLCLSGQAPTNSSIAFIGRACLGHDSKLMPTALEKMDCIVLRLTRAFLHSSLRKRSIGEGRHGILGEA
jgi:hypothetical protein